MTRPGTGRAWLSELAEPTLAADDDVLVQMLRVGVCGTDREVLAHGSGRDASGYESASPTG